MAIGRFVGIGVDEYRSKDLARLDHAVGDVEQFHELLGDSFEGQPLVNPTQALARTYLNRVKGSMDDEPRPLVLFWAGHAAPSGTVRLRLLARNSHPDKDEGLDIIGEVAS